MGARRPLTTEFTDAAHQLQSVSALARKFGWHRATVRRLLIVAGIDTSTWRPRHHVDRLAAFSPEDLAKARTRDEAKALLRCGSDTVSALARALGVTWVRRPRLERLMTHPARARRYLRLCGERVLDMGETYGQMHDGRRFVIDRRRMTAAELVERAISRGWRP